VVRAGVLPYYCSRIDTTIAPEEAMDVRGGLQYRCSHIVTAIKAKYVKEKEMQNNNMTNAANKKRNMRRMTALGLAIHNV
jgi:hypothetical protein